MFEFFKDVMNEINGIDVNTVKEEKRKQREIEKSEKYIFSKSAKRITISFMVLYIIISVLLCLGANGALAILKNIAMAVVALVVIFSLAVGKEKGEKTALISLFVFIVLIMLSITL